MPESLANKTNKRHEEKININIFLAQSIPELDLTSDSESGVKQAPQTKPVKKENFCHYIQAPISSYLMLNFISITEDRITIE